jgi:diadenosine tetraphosphate (Ap4A) HIT family hydrolase
MGKKYINKKYAKTEDYRSTLEAIEESGICPFCPEHFKYHKKPILKRESGWLITENSWPYVNAAHHYVLIPDAHKEDIGELTARDWEAVRNLTSWIVQKEEIKGAALAVRFGDTDYTGGSVTHIHFQLISPKHEQGESKVVIFPIG